MIRLELPFPVPLSACFTNVKGRGRVPTVRYKAWTETSLWLIKSQRVKPVDGPVSVYVRLVAPDKRHRDADNTSKGLLDILKKAGVILDDSNRVVRRVTTEWQDEGPACLVIIQRCEEMAA